MEIRANASTVYNLRVYNRNRDIIPIVKDGNFIITSKDPLDSKQLKSKNIIMYEWPSYNLNETRA